MIHSEIGYVMIGLAEFHFFLAQEDVAAVIGINDIDLQNRNHIPHAGYDYPFRTLPDSIRIADSAVRYYLLLHSERRRFSLTASALSFIPLQHDLKFSPLPLCMREQSRLVSDVCCSNDQLLCSSTATALYNISSSADEAVL